MGFSASALHHEVRAVCRAAIIRRALQINRNRMHTFGRQAGKHWIDIHANSSASETEWTGGWDCEKNTQIWWQGAKKRVQGISVFPLIFKTLKYYCLSWLKHLRNYSCKPALPFLVTLKILLPVLELSSVTQTCCSDQSGHRRVVTSTSGFVQPGGVRSLPLLLSANEWVNVTALDPNAEDHKITYTRN